MNRKSQIRKYRSIGRCIAISKYKKDGQIDRQRDRKMNTQVEWVDRQVNRM